MAMQTLQSLGERNGRITLVNLDISEMVTPNFVLHLERIKVHAHYSYFNSPFNCEQLGDNIKGETKFVHQSTDFFLVLPTPKLAVPIVRYWYGYGSRRGMKPVQLKR